MTTKPRKSRSRAAKVTADTEAAQENKDSVIPGDQAVDTSDSQPTKVVETETVQTEKVQSSPPPVNSAKTHTSNVLVVNRSKLKKRQ